ncbi:MAG: septum formation initiator family protein [Clostridiales bacterium]|nr:septum formation initiator family protein [Clostridiales bacterium]
MTKKKHKKDRSVSSFIFTMVCIAFVVVGVLCATRMYEIHKRKESLLAENRRLQEQKQALIDRNNELLIQGTRSDDSAYIENVARSQLDMVYPGEVIFRNTGD